MLMENTVRLKSPKYLKYIFDMKGSTVDRLVDRTQPPSKTLKDINFIKIKRKHKNLTTLSAASTRKLVHGMRKDVEFLSSLNIMDYSMLIAIEKIPVS